MQILNTDSSFHYWIDPMSEDVEPQRVSPDVNPPDHRQEISDFKSMCNQSTDIWAYQILFASVFECDIQRNHSVRRVLELLWPVESNYEDDTTAFRNELIKISNDLYRNLRDECGYRMKWDARRLKDVQVCVMMGQPISSTANESVQLSETMKILQECSHSFSGTLTTIQNRFRATIQNFHNVKAFYTNVFKSNLMAPLIVQYESNLKCDTSLSLLTLWNIDTDLMCNKIHDGQLYARKLKNIDGYDLTLE
jgi:hypothetical protein